ncbi:MAG: hypothetical protein WA644_04975, partial [Candidatus Acidiferrales bacterium]
NAPQPNTWAAGSEQLSFISVGCEERKIRAGGGFFLDFFLYRAIRKLNGRFLPTPTLRRLQPQAISLAVFGAGLPRMDFALESMIDSLRRHLDEPSGGNQTRRAKTRKAVG